MAWSSKIYSNKGSEIIIKVTGEPDSTDEVIQIPWSLLSDLEGESKSGRKRTRNDVSVTNVIGILGPYSANTGKGFVAQQPTCKISWPSSVGLATDDDRLVIAEMGQGNRATIGVSASMAKDLRQGRKRHSGTAIKMPLKGETFGKSGNSIGQTNVLTIELGDSAGNWGADATINSFTGASFWITFEVNERTE